VLKYSAECSSRSVPYKPPPSRQPSTGASSSSAPSPYNARGKIDRATYKATIDIAILTADMPTDDEP
jgi:hypothetical protein